MPACDWKVFLFLSFVDNNVLSWDCFEFFALFLFFFLSAEFIFWLNSTQKSCCCCFWLSQMAFSTIWIYFVLFLGERNNNSPFHAKFILKEIVFLDWHFVSGKQIRPSKCNSREIENERRSHFFIISVIISFIIIFEQPPSWSSARPLGKRNSFRYCVRFFSLFVHRFHSEFFFEWLLNTLRNQKHFKSTQQQPEKKKT